MQEKRLQSGEGFLKPCNMNSDPYIIALLSMKGGVGKTSVAVNLCAALGEAGHASRLLDLDPQGSACLWGQLCKDDDTGAFVPSRDIESADLADLSPQASMKRLRAMIAQAGRAGAVFVVLDCPPGLVAPAQIAAGLAHLVLIPCTPSVLDVAAVQRAVALLKQARDLRGDGGPIVAVVPSKMQRVRLASELPEALDVASGGAPILAPIFQRIAVAECAQFGQTVFRFDSKSKSADEFGELCRDVLKFYDDRKDE